MEQFAISIFYDEEDGDYIAIVPDLKGCSAFGDTPEDALRQVLIAKEGWLEVARKHGDPIPEPRYRPPDAERTATG
ncbi:MAG: type II toxin-antitoxin system HicB family antitoxin [Actinomycetota bacterium]